VRYVYDQKVTCVTRVNATAKLLHNSKLCTINVMFCFYVLTVCNTHLSITHEMVYKLWNCVFTTEQLQWTRSSAYYNRGMWKNRK